MKVTWKRRCEKDIDVRKGKVDMVLYKKGNKLFGDMDPFGDPDGVLSAGEEYTTHFILEERK